MGVLHGIYNVVSPSEYRQAMAPSQYRTEHLENMEQLYASPH